MGLGNRARPDDAASHRCQTQDGDSNQSADDPGSGQTCALCLVCFQTRSAMRHHCGSIACFNTRPEEGLGINPLMFAGAKCDHQ